MNMISLLRGVLGLFLILGIAILFSNNRRRISWRLVGMGVLIQVVFAVFILYADTLRSWFAPLGWPKAVISWLGGAVVSLLGFTTEGSKFVFGRLAENSGPDSLGMFFAFQVLPTIIFVATLTSVLYYLGILQVVVKGMAWLMAKLMGTSGAESLSNTANIFVGQTEAPLLIKPYIGAMTNSEILTIMVGGMATIAGGVMAAYIQMLGQALAEVQKIPLAEAQLRFAVQLLAASVMAAPASLVIAKILYPETETPVTKGTVRLKVEKNASNFVEAAATGAGDGMQLALNVGAMLLAFIAGIALINYLFVGLGDLLQRQRLPDGPFRPAALAAAHFRGGAALPGHRHRRAGARCLPFRQPAGHQGGLERIRRLYRPGRPDQAGGYEPQRHHHGHLRPVRLRQFFLDRHPDRRHRPHGAAPQKRHRLAGPESRPGRHAGHADDRHLGRDPFGIIPGAK